MKRFDWPELVLTAAVLATSLACGPTDQGTSDDGSGSGAPSGGSGAHGGHASGDGGSVGNGNSDPGNGDAGSAQSPSTPLGRGATVAWKELQAEDAPTNATVLGPSRVKWDANHIEAEAIGRKAVRLDKTGDYVEFTTTAPANSIVVRYAIPDAPNGGGIQASLGLYIDGKRFKSMPLTSKYSWSYQGGLIAANPTDQAALNTPGPQPHTFFDEYNSGPGDVNGTKLPEMPAGTKVRIQKDAEDTAAFYVIDLVDFEEVAAPLTMPDGFKSVTDFGIQPNDGKDHADDIENALASGVTKLWFPPGEYLAQKFVQHAGNVALDNKGTEIRGAGMWYTRIRGKQAMFFCDVAAPCNYSDFAVFGEATARDEDVAGPQKAFAGPQGIGSTIANVWIEHEVGALWVGNDPPYQTQPTDKLHIHDVRIRNTYADGINLDNGTSNTLVENCHMRNTGDDAAVVWSIQWTKWVTDKSYVNPNIIKPESRGAPDQGIAHGNHFKHISVQMPWRANCFAAYGGYDNSWEDSTCEDVLTYPGILIDNEFSPYPFGSENTPSPQGSALTTFRGITLARAGGQMFLENTGHPWTHGALKLYMREGDVNDILVEDVDILDPTYSGIEFRGFGAAYVPPGEKYYPDVIAAAEKAQYSNVTIRNVRITNAGTYGIEILDGAGRGEVTFDGVAITAPATGALSKGNAGDTFFKKINVNTGW